MLVGERLRTLRASKHLSQGDIEKRTGLKRSYISRVENGHTVPSVGTLAKFAQAIGIPVYRVFYEGRTPPRWIHTNSNGAGGRASTDGRRPGEYGRFFRILSKLSDSNLQLLLFTAQKLTPR